MLSQATRYSSHPGYYFIYLSFLICVSVLNSSEAFYSFHFLLSPLLTSIPILFFSFSYLILQVYSVLFLLFLLFLIYFPPYFILFVLPCFIYLPVFPCFFSTFHTKYNKHCICTKRIRLDQCINSNAFMVQSG